MPSRRGMALLAAGAAFGGGCGLLFGLHVELLALAAGAGLVLMITIAVVRGVVAHARLTAWLGRVSRPGRLADTRVRTAAGLGPMVAGLLRPRVYCGDDTCARLTLAEQRAVLLHERCHQRRRDPARLVVLDALEATLGSIPAVRRWIVEGRARLEIRADLYALEHGAARPDIASALLALSGQQPAGVPAFASATQQRLEALLDGPPRRRRLPWRSVASGLAATALAAAACLPALAGPHVELARAGGVCLGLSCGAAG